MTQPYALIIKDDSDQAAIFAESVRQAANARLASSLQGLADFAFVKPVGFKQLSQLVMHLPMT